MPQRLPNMNRRNDSMDKREKGVPELVNVETAAELIGVCEATLTKWSARGVGPKRYRLGRKMVRYDKDECVDYLRNLPST